MNQITKTKIEWCDRVWNPVIGCKNKCPYCYARKMNNRFHFIQDFNIPEWKPGNCWKAFPKKPSRIFVNSMSDICFWKEEWMYTVIEIIKLNPQHTFLFLTKNSAVYFQFDFPANCWLGTTVTGDNSLHSGVNSFPNNKTFLSIEPIQSKIKLDSLGLFRYYNWIIVGAETGNRKRKVSPKREWISDILYGCFHLEIPLFMKNSLKAIMGKDFVQEFPNFNQ